jgi:hypothetical protein
MKKRELTRGEVAELPGRPLLLARWPVGLGRLYSGHDLQRQPAPYKRQSCTAAFVRPHLIRSSVPYHYLLSTLLFLGDV